MELKDMTIDQLEERKQGIVGEIDNEGADLDALEAEIKSINEELEARKAAEAKRNEIRSAVAKGAGTVIKNFEEDSKNMEKTYGIDSEEYRSAWVHALQGVKLTEVEERAYATTDSPNAVPQAISEKFFEKMKKLAPMLSEITLMQVAGNIKFMAEGTRNPAGVHTENSAVDPAADTLVSVELGGKEFMKVIRISQAAKTMSVNVFEDWLVEMLAGDIARAIDNYILNASGNGLVNMVSTATTNVLVQTSSAGYGYKDIVNLVALLPAAYDAEAKFLVTKKVLYNEIKGILDTNKRPIFDPVEKTLFGYPVVIDDYVPSDSNQVYLGKLTDIVGNLSQPVTVARSTESGFLNNSIDFRGTAIFDSKLAKTDAIVWLTNTAVE